MTILFHILRKMVLVGAIALTIPIAVFVVEVIIHLKDGGIPKINFLLANRSDSVIKNIKIICADIPTIVPAISPNDDLRVKNATYDGGEGCSVYADFMAQRDVRIANRYFSPGIVRIEIRSPKDINVETIL